MKKTEKLGSLLPAVHLRDSGGTRFKDTCLGDCKKVKGSYLSDPYRRKIIQSKGTVLFPLFYTLALACSKEYKNSCMKSE